jgi:hypothetical protein
MDAQFGKAGVGGIDSKKPIIYIDASLKDHPDKIAAVLAHEIGHARHPVPEIPMDGLTREQYVQRRVDALLDGEGAAALETVRYREEAGARGQDLDIAGFQDKRYQQIYADLKAGNISEQEAIHRAGQVAADHELHGDTRVTYRDSFTQEAEIRWDDEHPPEP